MKKFRIIDANVNRTCEGLRVLEDVFRFFYNNFDLSKKIKNFRHEIRGKVKDLNLIDFRDSENDVGKETFLKDELIRKNSNDIVLANFKRVEESLRVLEEIFKITNSSLSEFFKNLRFQIYSIEKIFFSKKIKFFNLISGEKTILYGIVDTRFSNFNHIETAKGLLDAGIKIIQLREKTLTDREFLKVAIEIKKLTEEYDAIFIVNDRIDIAHISDADGVHLGQDDLDIKYAREILGDNKIVGLSTHNFSQVKKAIELKPDYIGFGPIFETKSKENPDPVIGAENLRKLFEMFDDLPPVVAIGGINFTNIKDVLSCKPKMICVMSGIIGAKNIVEAGKKYMEIINDAT